MGVEAIHHQMPLRRVRVSGEHRLEVGEIVGFVPRIAHRAFRNAPGGHIETGNQRLGAMTGIFKLLPFAPSGSHRLVWSTPFQGLNTGHLINGEGAFAALRPLYGTQVEGTEVFDLRIKLWVGGGLSQYCTWWGFKSASANRRPTWRGEIRSTQPRFTISSASSRGVQ